MLEVNNILTQNYIASPSPYTGLSPAAGANQAKDRDSGFKEQERKAAERENEKKAGEETPRPHAPITPPAMGGAMFYRPEPLEAGMPLVEPGDPEHALRRRARAYERMMIYY